MMQPISYHGVRRMSAISPALDISQLTHAITLRPQLLVALHKIGFGFHANCASNALHSDCGIIGASASEVTLERSAGARFFAGMSEAPLRGSGRPKQCSAMRLLFIGPTSAKNMEEYCIDE